MIKPLSTPYQTEDGIADNGDDVPKKRAVRPARRFVPAGLCAFSGIWVLVAVPSFARAEAAPDTPPNVQHIIALVKEAQAYGYWIPPIDPGDPGQVSLLTQLLGAIRAGSPVAVFILTVLWPEAAGESTNNMSPQELVLHLLNLSDIAGGHSHMHFPTVPDDVIIRRVLDGDTAVSTKFRDWSSMTEALTAAFTLGDQDIERWAENAWPGRPLLLSYHADTNVGYGWEVSENSDRLTPLTDLRWICIRLRAKGQDDWYVETVYPTAENCLD